MTQLPGSGKLIVDEDALRADIAELADGDG